MDDFTGHIWRTLCAHVQDLSQRVDLQECFDLALQLWGCWTWYKSYITKESRIFGMSSRDNHIIYYGQTFALTPKWGSNRSNKNIQIFLELPPGWRPYSDVKVTLQIWSDWLQIFTSRICCSVFHICIVGLRKTNPILLQYWKFKHWCWTCLKMKGEHLSI